MNCTRKRISQVNGNGQSRNKCIVLAINFKKLLGCRELNPGHESDSLVFYLYTTTDLSTFLERSNWVITHTHFYWSKILRNSPENMVFLGFGVYAKHQNHQVISTNDSVSVGIVYFHYHIMIPLSNRPIEI
jgi:hypothetical protein